MIYREREKSINGGYVFRISFSPPPSKYATGETSEIRNVNPVDEMIFFLLDRGHGRKWVYLPHR